MYRLCFSVFMLVFFVFKQKAAYEMHISDWSSDVCSSDLTQVAQVIERTLNTTPKDATHWSIRSMAAKSGLSHTTIRRIWGAFGLQPHRSETFKLSTDPLFVDKVQD